MKRTGNNTVHLIPLILVLYIIFFTSLFFSLRAISSISIGLLLIAGAIKQNGIVVRAIRSNGVYLITVAGGLFLLLQFISVFYTDNTTAMLEDIERKSGLLLIPLAVILTGPFSFRTWKILTRAYCILLLAASLYSLVYAVTVYSSGGSMSVFFYHSLVSPIHQHAVYFSIYVFIALVFLLEHISKRVYIGTYFITIAIAGFFSCLLFLLSSKLVISFYILYLLYYLFSPGKRNVFPKKIITGLAGLVIVGICVVFLTRNPVRARFIDIIHTNFSLVKQDRYTPADYFNGIQFRLLQWKFVPEILNRHQAWLKGVGPANAQPFLDEEYSSKNMYLGDPVRGDHLGYRAYNTHNQALESLLSYGVPGLLGCLLLFIAMIETGRRRKQRDLGFIIALLLIYALVESVFETQYGIVLFVFFPSFLCQYQPTRSRLIPI